ncbi:MAG: hypothetical protein KJN90_04555, partial [Gammaproteobacteria bacterium]|nr:hypothetical protein [Gammaproteobacteria bacterium]
MSAAARASGRCGKLIRIFLIRQIGSAARKNPIVLVKIAKELEKRSIARVSQHHPGISANRHHLAFFKQMVIIQ